MPKVREKPCKPACLFYHVPIFKDTQRKHLAGIFSGPKSVNTTEDGTYAFMKLHHAQICINGIIHS